MVNTTAGNVHTAFTFLQPGSFTVMTGTSDASQALRVLHYISPVFTGTFFLVAKTISACLLLQPSPQPNKAAGRYPAIAVLVLIALSALPQLGAQIVDAVQQHKSASQDALVYVLLTFLTYGALALGILENKKPRWNVYLSTCLVGLIWEINCLALQAVADRSFNALTISILALQFLRVCLLLAFCVTGIGFGLRDRVRDCGKIDEIERLLPDGSSNTHQGNEHDPLTLDAQSYGTETRGTDNDDDEDYAAFDSDSEDPEKDRELRKQRLQRLQERGSWLAYLKDYKIFLPILWPGRNIFLQFCMFLMALVIVADRALMVLIPRQFGIVVDELTSGAGTGVLPWQAIGLWLLYTWLGSSAGVKLIRQFAELPVQQWSHRSISTTAFRHIMCLSMDFHSNKSSGELIAAIEQGRQLQNLLEYLAFDILPTFLDFGIAFVYVYMLFDICMALILSFVGVTYSWIGAKTTVWSIKQRRRFNTAWRAQEKTQTEAINQWPTVSHFNQAEFECKRYTDIVDEFNRSEWSYYVSYYLGSSAQSSVMFLGRAAASLLAAYRVASGTNRVGDFVTLLSYWSRIEDPLSEVSWSIRRISQMLTDSERLLQLLLQKPTVTNAPGAKDLAIKAGTVEFDHVEFSYDPRKPTLKDISFSVKAGQTVALVGETGAGKSTVIKLLYRYYDISSGSIRIDGQDIRNVTLDSLRDAFGMVPQDPSLFNASIMDNIRYARLDATDEDVMDACRAAAIHDKILSFPEQYNSKVGERGVKLSGGELQRIAIARGIIRRPKIVLLDEATSMIDAGTESLIQQAFTQLTANRTTFVIAHRLSTIQHADLILVFNGQGQIIERGTHAELFRLKGRYVELWSKQVNKEVQDVGNLLHGNDKDELKSDSAGDKADAASESEQDGR